MSIYYQGDKVVLHHGDCLDVLATLPDASVDAVVTDPPYGLANTDPAHVAETITRWVNGERDYLPGGSGFMGAKWDAFVPPVAVWDECLRVLKPGGHVLAFAGSRTVDLMTLGLRLAGFDIRDSIAWLYAQGFSKGGTLGRKAGISLCTCGEPDGALRNSAACPECGGLKQEFWGYSTTLKPAFEPIVMARKPLTGTVAANVLEWGCGAINVNACRIGPDEGSEDRGRKEARAGGCPVHGLPGVRNADAESQVGRGAGQDARDVLAELPEQADDAGAESPLERRSLDGGPERVSGGIGGALVAGGPGATAAPAPTGVPRAQVGHGPQSGSPPHVGRDGSPHQWREGRQPAGEPASDGLGGALSRASADRAGTDATQSGERPSAGCTCGADREVTRAGEASADRRYTERGGTNFAPLPGPRGGSSKGRWPANVILDESQAEALDEQSGTLTSGAWNGKRNTPRLNGVYGHAGIGEPQAPREKDSGGASRFFYVAKAPKSERPVVDGVAHPTVKPVSLMSWLVRLVTPPGGTVLEPFAGSGTTVEAAMREGFNVVAVEREADYLPLIMARIDRENARQAAEDANRVPTLFDEEKGR